MVLISGLPDEVVYDCLIRVKYDQFPTITSVCKGWKSEVELPEFHRLRKNSGYGQKLVAMVQACVASNQGGAAAGVFKCLQSPTYRFTVCEPDSGDWGEFPPISVFPGGSLPMFCQFAAVGTDLVVVGGLDPVTWASCKSVVVYNFMTGTWRRGADMPGGSRIFFGCASDSNRTVFVAGGHDDEKNALRTAMAYDVAKDEWILLPDMERERDECKVIFQHDKLQVIGGYNTEMQGRFERTAETFNISTWQWDCVQEDFLQIAMCPRTCVVGNDRSVYMCHDGNMIKQGFGMWQIVAELPPQVRNPASVTTWHNKLLVIGCLEFGGPHMAYMLNLENNTWSKLETSEKYSGHVQSSCYLEI
ncbi:PREDICTED: F-box/kelch-repeat protein At1g15670-like [Fragaria vesca subsp. vesca]|uniref:F-box/kelch-repeat protein At1g15670-like n=1 Tax=Fragaria vesca subsp. vesca TaxID=101020 RepID=UPI0002C2DD14|nr:PREDICTED: F-box/kelch-repeat protein At1g15670-like [Fragaria vesca subsp. vesca]